MLSCHYIIITLTISKQFYSVFKLAEVNLLLVLVQHINIFTQKRVFPFTCYPIALINRCRLFTIWFFYRWNNLPELSSEKLVGSYGTWDSRNISRSTLLGSLFRSAWYFATRALLSKCLKSFSMLFQSNPNIARARKNRWVSKKKS